MKTLRINKHHANGIQTFVVRRVRREIRPKRAEEAEDFADTDQQTPRQVMQDSSLAPASRISDRLTIQEKAVMRLLARGLRYKEIADRLGLSYAKVHKLQHKIYVKLPASNAAEAVAKWAGLNPDTTTL